MQRSCLRAVLLETLWITSFPLSLCISKVTLQMVDAHKCVFGIWAGRGGRGCFPRSEFPELTENEVGFVQQESFQVSSNVWKKDKLTKVQPDSGLQGLPFSCCGWSGGFPDDLRFGEAQLGYSQTSVSALEVCFACVQLSCFCTVLTKEGDLRVEQLLKKWLS